MATLPLHEVRPGMMLASALVDRSGRPLLAEGTTLSEAMIESLERRGIDALEIALPQCEADGSGPGDEAARETQRMAAQDRITHLFRRARNTGIDETLYRTVLEYRLENLR